MDYQIRLYRNKKTLGVSNKEIGELMNKETGFNYDESKFRKEADGWLAGIDYSIRNSLEEEVIEMYDAKIDELYKQQVKTRDKLREYRAGLRSEGRLENLFDTMAEVGRNMQSVYPFELDVEYSKVATAKVGVLTISDWHYGQQYKNFLGEYNVETLIRRMSQVINETIDECRMRRVTELKVLNLGDMINGLIHLGTRVESEEDAITQIMHVSELIADMLDRLAKHFNKVEYYDTLDNHSRISADKKQSIESENLGRLISFYLKPRLAGVKNIVINDERLDETISMVNILGEKCFAVHGHLDRPNTVINNLITMTKIIPKAVFMGHFHHHLEEDKNGIDLIVNGSMSGIDTFAKEHRLTSKSLQKLHIYEKINNKVKRTAIRLIEF